MSASVTVSEQEFLMLIWQISLALATFSFIILFCLVIARCFLTWKKNDIQKRKDIFSRYLYAALSSSAPISASSLPVLAERDKDAVCAVALDILRSLKGKDKTSIAALLDTWGLKPHLLNTLRKGTRGQRIQALTLLASFDDQDTLQALLAHAGSKEIYVQLAALHGLAARAPGIYIGRIIADISGARETNILLMADVLSRFGEAAVPSLLQVAAGNAVKEVRASALIALANIRSMQATEPLMSLLEDAEADIRVQAAAALGKIGDIRAEGRLIGKLADESPPVRVQAAQALGALKSQSSLSALAERLYDENWWVRFRAAEALHLLGASGIALLRSFSAAEDHAGIIARQVLAERGA
jgi:HEAT repeat protein